MKFCYASSMREILCPKMFPPALTFDFFAPGTFLPHGFRQNYRICQSPVCLSFRVRTRNRNPCEVRGNIDCIRRGKPDWLPPLHLLSSVRICILFFAILTTIYFFFFIGKKKDLIEFLLNRCHATRILTFDYIAYLLRQ